MDICYYLKDAYDQPGIMRMGGTGIDAPPVTGLEVVSGKVVKFMLTQQGTDAFNPDYGGVALHYRQLARSELPRFRMDVLEDIDRCARFIRQSEANLPPGVERLSSIRLEDILEDQGMYRVKITVTSTGGSSSLLVMGAGSNG